MNEIFNNLLSVPMHQLSAGKANRRTRLSQKTYPPLRERDDFAVADGKSTA